MTSMPSAPADTTHRAITSAAVALAVALAAPVSARAQTGDPHAPPGYETQRPTVVPAAPYGYEQYGAQPGYATTAPQGQTVLVVAQPIQAQPAQAMPPMERVPVERSASIRGLWLPGLIVLPVAWVTTWTVSSSVFEGDAATYSWIPVLGPWLMLTQDLNGAESGIILSGVVQGVAALALVLGLTIRRTWTEYEYRPAGGGTARISLDALTLPGGGMVGARIEL